MTFCRTASIALLTIATPWFGPAAQANEKPPNIVLFYVDDLGWRDVGYMGSKFYETPHIDRLATSGIVFRAAYANGPNCAPSRASLMTGLYTPRHGIYTVSSSARGDAALRKLVPIENTTTLAPDFVTIAEVLREAGYATASMGKWHLGPDPCEQGFDVNVAGNRSGSPRGGHFSPYKNRALPNGPEGEYLTDRLTDEAVAFIDQHKERPFFLYLTHYAVHTPIQAKKTITARYREKSPDGEQRNAKYAAMIESVDESLGRVLDTLDKLDLADNTIVVFYSDNGGHGGVTSMAPLRGAKGMLYEGGIRVPLVFRWPDRIKAGRSSDVPVIGTDLFPTFLAIAEAKPPSDQELDGISLLPLLTGTVELPARELFWHFPAYLQATKKSGRPFRTRPAGAIRSGNYKLIEFFEDGRLELYDLATDPCETRNLADDQPEVVARLHASLRDWRAGINAPVPTEPNPRYDPERDRRR